jgi:hypothetical protein
MLDMVKAFERVPHDWLVVQARRYAYPLTILRLSLGAYRLERVLTVGNVCAQPVSPTRGITAGSVHATVELRLLLLQWLDQALAFDPRLLTATVYVDDVSLECSGSEAQVARTVAAAAHTFTRALEGMGMAFSPTKNAVVASSPALADAISVQLGHLVVAKLRGALLTKSGSGAVCASVLPVQYQSRSWPPGPQPRRSYSPIETSVFLDTIGSLATMVGLPSTGLVVIPPAALATAASKDLLVFGSLSRQPALATLLKQGAIQVQGDRLTATTPDMMQDIRALLLTNQPDKAERDRVVLALNEGGDGMGAVIGVQSPLQGGRSVVAITGLTPAAMAEMSASLRNPELAGKIQGDISLQTGDHIAAFRTAEGYELGALPLWLRAQIIFGSRPERTGILLLITSCLIGIPFFWILRRRAARRLRARMVGLSSCSGVRMSFQNGLSARPSRWPTRSTTGCRPGPPTVSW